MKLVFKKNSEAKIGVFQRIGDSESNFSYVEMIKSLISSQKLEAPELSDGFTEAERKSIQSMVDFINERLESTLGAED